MKNERMFKEYMTALSELHGKELSALLNSLYWKTLEPFTDQECEQAFKELIFSAKFFPKPADFLEILKGKDEDQGTRAWIKVIENMRRVGPWESVQFDDPVIHSVLKFMGGWSAIDDWKPSELKWKQKEFERLYVIMSKGKDHPQYLPGMHETENGSEGRNIVKIGYDEGQGGRVYIHQIIEARP
jgi:hypothetical protein